MNRVNVPQLRFNGFEGEWKNCLLNDITKYVKGFAFKSEDYQENGVRIVRVSDLSADRIKNNNEKVFIDEDKSKVFEKYKLSAGNIVITTVGSKPEMIESAVGRGIYIHNDIEGLLNQNMLKFENIKNVTNGYIIGLINTKRYQHYMKSIARGNANQANITVVDLLQYQVSIPTFPEQQKIASFLSAVDEKLQHLSRKAELLEQYKKGVMQKLFSGKLRFKDENGNDYSDWEEKKLGEVGELKNGLNKDKKDFGVGSPFVNLMDVFGKTEIYNQEFGLVNSNDKEKVLYNLLKGDVLFIRSSVKRSGVGGTVVVQEDLINTVYSGFLIRFRDDRKSLAQEFKKYCFSAQSFRDEILSYATSSANTNINQESLNKINLNLPCIEEQQKIAAFLFSIDVKIESTNQQINQTQSFKKGLLQQLFV